MHDTFHGKKDSVAKDSTVNVRVDSSSVNKLIPGGKDSVIKWNAFVPLKGFVANGLTKSPFREI